MGRVHIMGGQGSGKTTLARRVGEALGSPVYEMDLVGWETKTGRERSVEEKLELVGRIVAGKEWVTDGTMLGWTDPLLRAADLVVWLDVPWRVAVWRMLLRHARAELSGKNRHPGWRRLLRFIWYTRHYYLDVDPGDPVPVDGEGRSTRRKTAERVAGLGEKAVRCRTRGEVEVVFRRIVAPGAG